MESKVDELRPRPTPETLKIGVQRPQSESKVHDLGLGACCAHVVPCRPTPEKTGMEIGANFA